MLFPVLFPVVADRTHAKRSQSVGIRTEDQVCIGLKRHLAMLIMSEGAQSGDRCRFALPELDPYRFGKCIRVDLGLPGAATRKSYDMAFKKSVILRLGTVKNHLPRWGYQIILPVLDLSGMINHLQCPETRQGYTLPAKQ